MCRYESIKVPKVSKSSTTRKTQSDNTHQTTLGRKSVAWKRQTTVNSQHSESIVWTKILTRFLKPLSSKFKQTSVFLTVVLSKPNSQTTVYVVFSDNHSDNSFNPLSKFFGQTTVFSSDVVFRWTITQRFLLVLWESKGDNSSGNCCCNHTSVLCMVLLKMSSNNVLS